MNFEVVAAAEDILAEVPLPPGFGDRLCQYLGLVDKLATDVDVGRVGPDGIGRDRDALEDHVGVAENQLTILECSGLRFVGVTDHVFRFDGVSGYETPFNASRETGTAASANPRCLDFCDHLSRSHRQRLVECGVAPQPEVSGNRT